MYTITPHSNNAAHQHVTARGTAAPRAAARCAKQSQRTCCCAFSSVSSNLKPLPPNPDARFRTYNNHEMNNGANDAPALSHCAHRAARNERLVLLHQRR